MIELDGFVEINKEFVALFKGLWSHIFTEMRQNTL